jgi:hypothetical protein
MLFLQELCAERNELKGLEGWLADCRKLASLRLNDNHITLLSGLRGLHSLEVGRGVN